MDKVFIKGLAIQTTLGFFQWEKEIKKTFIIDVDIKTLDYAEISLAIETFANKNPVDLLETLAERMASYLMSQFHIPWLRLSIGKPGAVHNTITVGVEIERGQLPSNQLCVK